jgi:CubicO group peptidase (beta-lactamase class C family)
VTPRTRFHIASCGKQLTGIGIMMLEEAGKLRHDDHIGAHIPELVGFPRGFTIRALLHHLAGVRMGGFESHIIRARNRPLSVYVLGNGARPDPEATAAFRLFA